MKLLTIFLLILSFSFSACGTKSERLTRSGMILEHRGYLDKAEKKFDEALKINPDEALAHIGLGYIYYKKGMYDEAIAAYKKGLEGHPKIAKEYPEAHYYLGLAYNKKNMTEEARKEFNKYRKLQKPEI